MERLCYRKWLMLFSLKLQRDNRKNALTVDPAKWKTGKKLYFLPHCGDETTTYITKPLEKGLCCFEWDKICWRRGGIWRKACAWHMPDSRARVRGLPIGQKSLGKERGGLEEGGRPFLEKGPSPSPIPASTKGFRPVGNCPAGIS